MRPTTTSSKWAWTGGGSWEPEPEPERDDDDDDGDSNHGGLRSEASGLVLGRFMPPHRGHQFLVDFAARSVDHLTVVVVGALGDPIPLSARVRWLRAMAPGVQVLSIEDPHPEAPDRLRRQTELIRSALPAEPMYLFSSHAEPPAAEGLGRIHVPVDPERAAIPISATMLRDQPMEHWRFLPTAVRADAVRRVRIVGAGATGKTTLARRLARDYDTVFVPEYARGYAAQRDGTVPRGELSVVARGQCVSEDALAGHANRVLLCDTDLLSVSVWSRVLHQRCPEWIEPEIPRRPYDLTLLSSVVDSPDRRQEQMHQMLVQRLERVGTPYVLLEGSAEARRATAKAAIDQMLMRPGFESARMPWISLAHAQER